MAKSINVRILFLIFIAKNKEITRHYGRHNVIYGKAWYSHDNSLGQAVPGTANLAN